LKEWSYRHDWLGNAVAVTRYSASGLMFQQINNIQASTIPMELIDNVSDNFEL
jgi:hypothetical protein